MNTTRTQKRLVESLEQRRMLTTWSVSPGVDGAADSLRSVISASNANGESDLIELAPGEFLLTLGGSDNTNAAGDLDIGEAGHRLLIRGAGVDQTFIDGSELDRVIDVLADADVVISDLTIRGGNTDGAGGGIRNSGSLTLNRVNIEGNTARHGGGIFSASELNLVASTITNNSADLGGGVANLGELTVSGSTIASNMAEDGAGIWNGFDTLPRYEEGSEGGSGGSGGSSVPVSFPVSPVDPIAPGDFIEVSTPADPVVDSFFPFEPADPVDPGFDGDFFIGGGGGALRPDIIIDPFPPFPIEPPIIPNPVEQFQAGTLTAGTIDDHLDVEELLQFASPILESADTQGLNPLATAPIPISVSNANAEWISNAKITVRETGSEDVLLETFTNSAGLSLYLPAADGHVEAGFDITVQAPDSEQAQAFSATTEESSWSFVLDEATQQLPQQLDVALVVDVTGSMSDELEFLKIEIESIAAEIDAEYPGVDVRFSMVVYRDTGDQFVTRTLDFVDSVSDFQDELAKQRARGGGDYPEAMHTALEETEKLSWRDGNTSRVAFLVADAPPHNRHFDETMDSVLDLRDLGIHIYPVGASGVANEAEAVMRTAAYVTNGEYLFLTDHSGFGNPHADPNTDSFNVEFLDDAMLRMIQQELQGEKLTPEEIIDRVHLTAKPEIDPGKLIVVNSTISGNEGDGVSIVAGRGEINNSTVVDEVKASGALALFSTIVDGSVDGSITSEGYNLFSADVTTGDDSDIVATPVLLGELTDNGGSTPTHLPLEGSPAIDSGESATGNEADQLGAGGEISSRDIGAVEASLVDAVVGDEGYDFADFLVLSHNYRKTDATLADGDLTGDGIVNFADFLVLTANYRGAKV